MEKKTEKEMVLMRFMKEFFPFGPLRKAGFFTKEMKNDYEAQAKRVCDRLGYKTVFEYRSKEIRCHISPVEIKPGDTFVTVMPSIYE